MSVSAHDNQSGNNAAALQILITLESEALAAVNLNTLRHIAVNRPRRIIQAGHIFWIARRRDKIKIEAI